MERAHPYFIHQEFKRMDIDTYQAKHELSTAEMAKIFNLHPSYIRQSLAGNKVMSDKACRYIEQATQGQVTAKEAMRSRRGEKCPCCGRRRKQTKEKK